VYLNGRLIVSLTLIYIILIPSQYHPDNLLITNPYDSYQSAHRFQVPAFTFHPDFNIRMEFCVIHDIMGQEKINIFICFWIALAIMPDCRMKIIFVLFCAFFCLFSVPVSAMIDVSSSSVYDANGETSAAGEEILVTVVVKPGQSDIENLKITFREMDALIDPLSFEKSMYPIGSQASISVDNNVLSCDRLVPGEVLTITFHAYPKTIQQSMITPVQMVISYVQLGQEITEQKAVTTDMTGSAWKVLQNTKTTTNNAGLLVILTALVIAIVIILVLILKMKTLKVEDSSQTILKRDTAILEEIRRRLDLLEDTSTDMIDLKHYVINQLNKMNKTTFSTNNGDQLKTKDHKKDQEGSKKDMGI